MNENIDLTKILKDCPKGTKLYSPMFGEVYFKEIRSDDEYAIITTRGNHPATFTGKGFYYADVDGECTLFPSRDQKDWSKFTAPWYKKESENEKIKNAILNHLKEMWGNCQDDVCGVHAEDAIDWLEEQGKQKKQVHFPKFTFDDVLALQCCMETVKKVQEDKDLYEKLNLIHGKIYDAYSSNTEKINKKPTDKIEPKFKVGDWVVSIKSGGTYQVEKIENYKYTLKHIFGSSLCLPFSNEELIREWTINDAKDGDVLALSWLEDKNLWEKIIIFKKYHSEGVKGLYSMPCVEGYGKTFKNGKIAFTDEEVPYYSKTWTCNLYPATKEQRNLLFQKIKEAGYKWNDETKILEKLIKPKFKVGDRIRHKATNKDDVYEIRKVYDDSYGIAGFTWMIYMKYQDLYELVPNKFDPKTLKAFDRVLVRDSDNDSWCCDLFSHIKEENMGYKYVASGFFLYRCCIPYNDDTKHLVGTTDEAPEYYRYWED